jgi:hypothetical protein
MNDGQKPEGREIFLDRKIYYHIHRNNARSLVVQLDNLFRIPQ